MCPPTQTHEGRTIRCVLIHDHVLLRQGLRRLLEDEPDMQVVAEAENTADALQGILRHRPDVVISDPQIFECPADQSEQMILRASPTSKVLFLTAYQAEVGERTSVAARTTSAEELVEMVRRTTSADSGHGATQPVEIAPRKRMLTARENEVLKLLAEGRTVRSAAGVLGLSVKTVDAHKFNLMRKLGIHNKAELVMWAIQKRVVKLPVNF